MFSFSDSLLALNQSYIYITGIVTDVTGQRFCLDLLKAYGPDGRGPRIIKELTPELTPVIAVPLSKLFQACI